MYPGFGSKGDIKISISINPNIYRRTLTLIGERCRKDVMNYLLADFLYLDIQHQYDVFYAVQFVF
jgi:hypothetical protein